MTNHSRPDRADYSHIDTREKAEALCAQGKLERLWLMPEEFGGQDVPQNIVHVPLGFVAMKRGADLDVIMPLVRAGKVVEYAATPQYAGDCLVPTAILVTATSPEPFAQLLRIWGEGLTQA
jgi:hypothetical protein